MDKKRIYIGALVISILLLAGCSLKNPKPEPVAPEPTPPVEQKGINVELPNGGQNIQSPLQITGTVSGDGWIAFEAQTGTVELLDGNGQRLALGLLTASVENWMTTIVPFETMLTFGASSTAAGTLVFRNENPSGRQDLERELRLPVTFAQVGETMTVKVFFGSSNAGAAGECENVLPVERKIAKTQAVGRAALEELLKGPTEEEKDKSYLTSINPGVKIQSLTISGGTARVDFSALLDQNVGGSCRVAAIAAQITETLKQFPTVQKVIISVDGRTEDILQP